VLENFYSCLSFFDMSTKLHKLEDASKNWARIVQIEVAAPQNLL